MKDLYSLNKNSQNVNYIHVFSGKLKKVLNIKISNLGWEFFVKNNHFWNIFKRVFP